MLSSYKCFFMVCNESYFGVNYYTFRFQSCRGINSTGYDIAIMYGSIFHVYMFLDHVNQILVAIN